MRGLKKDIFRNFTFLILIACASQVHGKSSIELCNSRVGLEQAHCFEQQANSLVRLRHNDIGHIHYRDDDDALHAYALAVQAFDGEQEQAYFARTYYALGSLLALQNKHIDAVNFLARAVAILNQYPDYSPLLRAQATSALGASHAKLEIFPLAQVHARNALEICEQFSLSSLECKLPAQLVIADVYRVAQDFYSASEVFKTMQSYLNAEQQKSTLLAVGLQSKQLASAAQLPNNGVEKDNVNVVRTAITALEKYQKLIDENSEVLYAETIETLESLARLYLKLKQPATALLHARDALSLKEKTQGKYAHNLLANFNLLAQCYLGTREIDKAYQALTRAKSLYWVHTSFRLRSESFDLLSQVMQLKSNPHASIFYSKRALTSMLFASRKIRLSDPVLGRYLVASRPELFRNLASKLFDAGRLVEGEYALRYLKENEYQDFKHEFGDAMSDSEENEFEAPLKQQLYLIHPPAGVFEYGLFRPISTLVQAPTSIETRFLRRQEFETEMELHFERVSKHFQEIEEIFLSSSAQQQVPSNQTQVATDEKTQSLTRADNNTALLHYLVTHDRTYVLLHTAYGLKLHKIEISKIELEKQVRQFLDVVKNPKLDPRIAGQKLYTLLFEAAEFDLKKNQTKNLLFSLDALLMSLPMAALHDGSQFLIQQYSVAQYSSTQIDNPTVARLHPMKNVSIALFGLSYARAGFPALKGVKEELRSLQKLTKANRSIPTHLSMNNDFTEQGLQKLTAQHIPYIHIASHHYLNTNDADTSFVLLGDGKKLSISDLKNEKFDFSNVELLTLSACNTATTSLQVNGLAMEGLGLTLQKRGAKSVLASKWAIDDLSTAKLMRNFYQQLFSGNAKAEALRIAQVQFLKYETIASNRSQKKRGAERQRVTPSFYADTKRPFAHPYYWAGFVLMGDWL